MTRLERSRPRLAEILRQVLRPLSDAVWTVAALPHYDILNGIERVKKRPRVLSTNGTIPHIIAHAHPFLMDIGERV